MTRVAVGVAPGSCCRLSGPDAFDNANLGTVEFRKKVSCPVVGKRCHLPKGKVGKFRTVGFQEVPPWSPEVILCGFLLYFGLLIGAGSNPCCKAFYPNDRLFTLHFSMAVFRSWPLQYLDTHTVKTFSWENDPFCNELPDHHHQTQMEHMGDVTQTDFPAFCQQLATQFDTTPHSHNISTPLQRPFSGPRRTSRHISHACRPLPTANGLYGRRSFPIFNRYVSSREGRWWLWITPKKIDGWKDVSYGPFEKVRSISFREGSNSFKKTTFYRYVMQSIVLI